MKRLIMIVLLISSLFLIGCIDYVDDTPIEIDEGSIELVAVPKESPTYINSLYIDGLENDDQPYMLNNNDGELIEQNIHLPALFIHNDSEIDMFNYDEIFDLNYYSIDKTFMIRSTDLFLKAHDSYHFIDLYDDDEGYLALPDTYIVEVEMPFGGAYTLDNLIQNYGNGDGWDEMAKLSHYHRIIDMSNNHEYFDMREMDIVDNRHCRKSEPTFKCSHTYKNGKINESICIQDVYQYICPEPSIIKVKFVMG